MDLDEAIAALHRAGLSAERAEPVGKDGPLGYEVISGECGEREVEDGALEAIGPFEISPLGDRWTVFPVNHEVATLDEAVAWAVGALQPKPCTGCSETFRGCDPLCDECQKREDRERKGRLRVERRSKFTLFAQFLRAKDAGFESIGLTRPEEIARLGLLDKTGVVDLYVVLRKVIAAFEVDPNDRAAYKRGMETMPKLTGLLKSYRDQDCR